MAAAPSEQYEAVFGKRPSDVELERLRCLTEELDPASERRLGSLPLPDDRRCLEIGAGTGTVAAWLARRSPNGEVMATDVDLRFLREVSEPNLEVRRHDVTIDDFPPESFDLIHARWVFVHLRDRDQLLERVASWLRPGGWLVLEEPARFPIDSSPRVDYRQVLAAHFDVIGDRIGTDPEWPRRFPAPLIRLGLEAVGLDVSCSVVGGHRPMGRFLAQAVQALAADMTASGKAAQADIDRVAELMYRDDAFDLGLATIAGWGRRPLGRPRP